MYKSASVPRPRIGAAGTKTTRAIAGSMARIDDKVGRLKGRATIARFMQLSTTISPSGNFFAVE